MKQFLPCFFSSQLFSQLPLANLTKHCFSLIAQVVQKLQGEQQIHHSQNQHILKTQGTMKTNHCIIKDTKSTNVSHTTMTITINLILPSIQLDQFSIVGRKNQILFYMPSTTFTSQTKLCVIPDHGHNICLQKSQHFFCSKYTIQMHSMQYPTNDPSTQQNFGKNILHQILTVPCYPQKFIPSLSQTQYKGKRGSFFQTFST